MDERGRYRRILIFAATVSLVAVSVAAIAYQTQFQSLREGIKADRILVEKSSRSLTLFRNDTLLKSYTIALGGEPIGKKQFQGDQKTPEGHYCQLSNSSVFLTMLLSELQLKEAN